MSKEQPEECYVLYIDNKPVRQFRGRYKTYRGVYWGLNSANGVITELTSLDYEGKCVVDRTRVKVVKYVPYTA